ncbi:hypothetical protein CB0940_05774, partial [Cercospora beticola]
MRRFSDEWKAIHNISSGPRPGEQELGLPLVIHGQTSHRRKATSRRRSEACPWHRHHTRHADRRKPRAPLACMGYNCIDAELKACISISSENLYQHVLLVTPGSRQARCCMEMIGHVCYTCINRGVRRVKCACGLRRRRMNSPSLTWIQSAMVFIHFGHIKPQRTT